MHAAVRDDEAIDIALPDTRVRPRRRVLACVGVNATVAATDRVLARLWGRPIDLELRGPERVALVGANGTGKTTVLHAHAARHGAPGSAHGR